MLQHLSRFCLQPSQQDRAPPHRPFKATSTPLRVRHCESVSHNRAGLIFQHLGRRLKAADSNESAETIAVQRDFNANGTAGQLYA